ncbi:6-pyruvoyltetrahydropterin/6-carboxytetrahydropterin synthase [Methanoculleus thermophilus]|jgi:6-pyruvoyltetrahydropterin/6-carboxytetrahydropterin synthase|uniref:6-pyruvoyltetrahydropterin/6-carboxytetrahydropterin synthase n=2 Tax=Methanomicrobiaceae TaxID=2194 RepID=A0A1G8WTB6_9EURY|nr:6-pyruvoyltetrahydropterin/6-carboxytetrahydropterin synthase [Methanoculleus thermophilus]
MMTTRIYKEVFFEATHRLIHYQGKCFRLHGHQWRVEVWIEGTPDERTGIVLDYNTIKEVVGRFDHQVILNEADPMAECIEKFHPVITTSGDPTSELLAGLIAEMIDAMAAQQGSDARVAKIRVWESASSYAERTYVRQ